MELFLVMINKLWKILKNKNKNMNKLYRDRTIDLIKLYLNQFDRSKLESYRFDAWTTLNGVCIIFNLTDKERNELIKECEL